MLIPLRGRDGAVRAHATIDDVDAHLAEHRWHLGERYVERSPPRPRTTTAKIRLHREVLGLKPGDAREGDHISGDRLDNRRSNLRITTHAENGQNVAKQPGRSSRYRGVAWHKKSGRWQARGRRDGRPVHIALFDDEEEAADAARAFRAQHMTHVNEQRSTAA